jgi:hypothetical protein
MKLLLRNLLPASTVLLMVAMASAQVPSMNPFTADMHISSPRSSQDMDGKIYIGSGHMRMNMENAGRETAIITDFATQTVDILMPQQQIYMEHKADEAAAHGPGNMGQDLQPYDPENPCANHPNLSCKKIGVEDVGGRPCDHWEITHKDGRAANVWIDQKLHFPLKAISKDSTLLLSNISEGEPDPALFQIPSEFKKIDLGGMLPPGAGGPPHQ